MEGRWNCIKSSGPVMEKIIKTPNQVAEQIERWFLRYYDKEKSAFDGSEIFTFF